MDPNENLKEQRNLVKRIMAEWKHDIETDLGATRRLAELVEALDEWIAGGGSLPTDWT